MYTTIRAELRDGRLIPLEPVDLPESGRVLVVILSDNGKQQDWESVRSGLGWLKTDLDPVAWQKKIRDEWDNRL